MTTIVVLDARDLANEGTTDPLVDLLEADLHRFRVGGECRVAVGVLDLQPLLPGMLGQAVEDCTLVSSGGLDRGGHHSG